MKRNGISSYHHSGSEMQMTDCCHVLEGMDNQVLLSREVFYIVSSKE